MQKTKKRKTNISNDLESFRVLDIIVSFDNNRNIEMSQRYL